MSNFYNDIKEILGVEDKLFYDVMTAKKDLLDKAFDHIMDPEKVDTDTLLAASKRYLAIGKLCADNASVLMLLTQLSIMINSVTKRKHIKVIESKDGSSRYSYVPDRRIHYRGISLDSIDILMKDDNESAPELLTVTDDGVNEIDLLAEAENSDLFFCTTSLARALMEEGLYDCLDLDSNGQQDLMEQVKGSMLDNILKIDKKFRS